MTRLTRFFPAPLHRATLRVAYGLRHRWRLLARQRIDGVSVIAHGSCGGILLVRHSYGPAVWALPGGGMSPNEHPLAAAAREIREELGCALENPRLVARLDEEVSGSHHVGISSPRGWTGALGRTGARFSRRASSCSRNCPATSAKWPSAGLRSGWSSSHARRAATARPAPRRVPPLRAPARSV